MCRIVGFVSCKGGVGKTSILKVIGETLSKKEKKVCLIDGYFGVNCLSLEMEKINDKQSVDLKQYLNGESNCQSVLNKMNQNLYFIKTNSSTFDYKKFKNSIQNFILEISNYFDYIFIDINNFDNHSSDLFLKICNEVLIVVLDDEIVIRNSAKLIQKICLYNNLKVKNILINFARTIAQIRGFVPGEKEIEKILKTGVIFSFPKLFKNNFFKGKNPTIKNEILISKLCYAFEHNIFVCSGEKKKYCGIIGRIKRRLYEKYE